MAGTELRQTGHLFGSQCNRILGQWAWHRTSPPGCIVVASSRAPSLRLATYGTGAGSIGVFGLSDYGWDVKHGCRKDTLAYDEIRSETTPQ